MVVTFSHLAASQPYWSSFRLVSKYPQGTLRLMHARRYNSVAFLFYSYSSATANGNSELSTVLVRLAKKVHESIVGPWTQDVQLESQHCIVRRVSSA